VHGAIGFVRAQLDRRLAIDSLAADRCLRTEGAGDV
jgi:hypothetical protein